MAPPVAGQTFPYRAYATTDNVYVRSGPGDNYYPTDKLKAGDEVEVYRHDPGGWYAIRPVPGSFSWVSGRYLQLGKDHLATVTEDHVAARVGSRFSDIRDVIQVRLHRGELVEVLDAQHTGSATSRPATPGTRSPRRRENSAGFPANIWTSISTQRPVENAVRFQRWRDAGATARSARSSKQRSTRSTWTSRPWWPRSRAAWQFDDCTRGAKRC